MNDYHKQYRLENEELSKAFRYLKRALGPKDVRPLCHYLMHDGNGVWVATDGFRLHEWRSNDCKHLGKWNRDKLAEVGEGQYKIIKLLKTYAVIEQVNGDMTKVKGASRIFQMSDPGYRGTLKIDVPTFPFPDKTYEASVRTYKLIGELYKDDSFRNTRSFNIQFLIDALQFGCEEVLLGCDNLSDLLYIKTHETTAVIMPIRA